MQSPNEMKRMASGPMGSVVSHGSSINNQTAGGR